MTDLAMEGEPAGGDLLQRLSSTNDERLRHAMGRLTTEQSQGLQEIATISSDIEELQLALKERAQALHATGVTWNLIGAALGMTTQGVHYRYGRKP